MGRGKAPKQAITGVLSTLTTRNMPLSEREQSEWLRLAALENAIASGQLEGFEFTPVMRDLLDRSSRGLISEAEFDREVLALARSAH